MSGDTKYRRDLTDRLILHAGTLSERFATEAARRTCDAGECESLLALVELGTAVALLAEAAFEITDVDLIGR